MSSCLDQVGPWLCLRKIILIMVVDVGKPILKVGGTIPWLGVLNCLGVEKAEQWARRPLFSSCSRLSM